MNLTDIQEKVWDSIADSWSERRNECLKEVRFFLLRKKGKILDLGCGSGRNFIKKNNTIFYGVDFSEKMLELAKKNAKQNNIKVFLRKADISELPFKDNFFDCAIFISALHCIQGEEKRKKALEELFRVLKNGAKALISVWSKNHRVLKNKKKETLIDWNTGNKRFARYYYIFDKEELTDLLKKIGFEVLRVCENKNIIIEIRKPS